MITFYIRYKLYFFFVVDSDCKSESTCLPDMPVIDSDRNLSESEDESYEQGSNTSDGSYDYYDTTGDDSEDHDYTVTEIEASSSYWTGLPQVPNHHDHDSSGDTTVTGLGLNEAHVTVDAITIPSVKATRSPPTNQPNTPQSGDKSGEFNGIGSHNSVPTGRLQLFGSPIQQFRTFVAGPGLMNSPVVDGVMSLVSAAKLFTEREEPTTVTSESESLVSAVELFTDRKEPTTVTSESENLVSAARLFTDHEEPTTITSKPGVNDVREAHRNADILNGPFAAIPKAMQTRIDKIINNKFEKPNTLVTVLFDIPISYGKFQCLKERTWLNDEIINLHMIFFQKRDAQLCRLNRTRKASHYFNSFFVNKLVDCGGYNYKEVKRYHHWHHTMNCS